MDELFLIKLNFLIEKEISNSNLDVDTICIALCLSRSQLYRKITGITGISINHYIRKVRLQKARQLIDQHAASISDIAFMTGFENHSYFAARFKEEFGMLPSEYNQKLIVSTNTK